MCPLTTGPFAAFRGERSYATTIMMSRVQIALETEDYRRLAHARATSGSRSPSTSAAWSRATSGSPSKPVDVSALFDLGDSGGSDIARDKDRMIGEAVEAGYL